MANITAEDFIAKFHSLDGTTIAQRRKNLFILLHQNATFKSSPALLDNISSNLVPKTFLESLFKLEFLIYFRRVQELYQILKEGNEVFISKISRQTWFFEEVFNNVQPEELVNEILPSMSYTVRMKVLRKLSKCVKCDRYDKIFDAVVDRYGIFVASKLITGCSPAKAREIIKDYPINLTHVQLKIFYKKDRDFIEFYFDNSNSSMYSSCYKNLVKFLFLEDRSLHDHLFKKYNLIHINLGQRTTKKFLKDEKANIVKDPHSYNNYIHMKAAVRKLGKHSIELFCNALPADYRDTSWSKKILHWFHRRHHYNLYIETLQKHYHIQYLYHPSLIDKFLLKLIPENSERAILAKVKVDDGDDEFIEYLATEDSIPLLKEKINVTSDIYERGKLVKYLIETCHINKDINSLAQVMKYFLHRHKNDELNVHMQFIFQIENLFGFKEFNEEMWKMLNDLLTIHMLKFDKTESTHVKFQTLPLISFNKGTSSYQKLSYLNFLFNKNEPIDELITEYLSITTSDFPTWGKYSKEFERYFLLHAIKLNSQETDEKKQRDIAFILIDRMENWNNRYKDDRMSFYDFPSLAHAFNYAIRNFDHLQQSIIKNFKNKIFTFEENDYKNEYLQIYWASPNRFSIQFKELMFFIKHSPSVLVQYFDSFVKHLNDNFKEAKKLKIWYSIKKYSHLELDSRAIHFSLSKLSDDTYFQNKSEFVICLSVLMKAPDFMSIANSYKPANKSLDLKNETEVRLYNLQCAIAQHFKHTKAHEVLPSLLDYCAGDYFKYSMRSLYAILHRTPENMLPQYLNYLAQKAVSVRKHVLYLTCQLCDLAKVESVLELLNKTEGVQSLQKYMFSTTIQYFVKNPSDNFFDMVKRNMLFINKTDDESHQCIVEKINQVPKKYKTAYIQYCWEFFEKIVDVWKKLLSLKKSLLRSMSEEIIIQLPLEFCLRILNEHFLTNKKSIDFYTMSNFGFTLLSCRSEKTVIMKKILDLVDERGDAQMHLQFHIDWYQKIMSVKTSDLTHMESFVNHYEKKINIIEHFDHYIKIFFLKTKLDFPEQWCVDDYSSRIFSLLENLTSNYGPHIIPLLAKRVQDEVHYFTSEEVTFYDYCHTLIDQHPVCSVAILLLNMGPRFCEPSKTNRKFGVFLAILQKLKTIEDPVVQINLQLKFKDCLKCSTRKLLSEGTSSK